MIILQQVWARSVLPLVLDGETRVQEKALESLDQLILKNVVVAGNDFGWSLLEIITELGLGTYLGKAVEMWTKQQMIRPQLIKILLLNTEQHGKAALTLIAIISRYTSVGSNVQVNICNI